MFTAKDVKTELVSYSDPVKQVDLQRFFKTGKGQYGEGDKFLGVVVPNIRTVVKKYKLLEMVEIEKLINDEYHECRMMGFLILVNMMKNAKPEQEEEIFNFYISHSNRANNWDLVDLSAPEICAKYFKNRLDRSPMLGFAKSDNLWLQRISIVGTQRLIKNGEFDITLEVSKILLHHKHDLIHKAVGWMLREVGKVNFDVEYNFLISDGRYKEMPRTMLRYAIEKFPEDLRQKFLKGTV